MEKNKIKGVKGASWFLDLSKNISLLSPMGLTNQWDTLYLCAFVCMLNLKLNSFSEFNVCFKKPVTHLLLYTVANV